MWWRFLLISFYLFLLLILSRILDVVVYYQGGFFAHKLLNPVSFGVQKLKAILDQRGLNYVGIVDKSDFTKLVDSSGPVMEGEIEVATSLTDSENEEELTIFLSAEHFLEKVEDSKDSAWLIQVIKTNKLPVTLHRRWKPFEKKISKFGIRNGIVNCTLDSILCNKKGWMASQLVLALPEGHKPKDQVMLKSFLNPTTPGQIARWIEGQLSARFQEINSIYDLKYNWLADTTDDLKHCSNDDLLNSKLEYVHNLNMIILDNNMPINNNYTQILNSMYITDVSISNINIEHSNKFMPVGKNSYLYKRHCFVDQLWLNNQDDIDKVKVIFMSPLNLIPMFLSALSVKFSGRVKFGFFHKNLAKEFTEKSEKLPSQFQNSLMNESIQGFDESITMEIGNYIVATPEGKILYGKGKRGQYPRFNAFSLFLKTLCPEVNDIFMLSLILINAATCLNLILSRIHSIVMRSLETLLLLLKTNFILLLIWVSILGLLQLPQLQFVTDILLSWLRSIALTEYADYIRADYLRIIEGNWGPTAVLLLVYLYLIYLTKRRMAPANEEVEVSNLIWFSRRGLLMQTLFQQHISEEDISGSTDTIEVGMEMLIESMAIPRLWLEPIVSPLYVHELPVWKFGYSSTDGTDSEAGEIEVSRCRCPSMRQKRSEATCRRGYDDSEERSDEERAKLVMDGDYICTCGHRSDESHGNHINDCVIDDSKFESDSDIDPEELWNGPEGMIPAEGCSICLERYRKGVLICGLPCGHHYHQMCIKLWLMRDHHCCPICRWPSFKRKSQGSNH